VLITLLTSSDIGASTGLPDGATSLGSCRKIVEGSPDSVFCQHTKRHLLQISVDAGASVPKAQQFAGMELVLNKEKPLRRRALTTLAEPHRLLRRLLLVLDKLREPQSLPPAGMRSGRGSESLAPYLEDARSTKPGDLR
jgi:hypothetical protein